MKWGVRRPEDHNALSRRIACAIFSTGAPAKLYTTHQVNAIGQDIYWLHLEGPSSAIDRIKGALEAVAFSKIAGKAFAA